MLENIRLYTGTDSYRTFLIQVIFGDKSFQPFPCNINKYQINSLAFLSRQTDTKVTHSSSRQLQYCLQVPHCVQVVFNRQQDRHIEPDFVIFNAEIFESQKFQTEKLTVDLQQSAPNFACCVSSLSLHLQFQNLSVLS